MLSIPKIDLTNLLSQEKKPTDLQLRAQEVKKAERLVEDAEAMRNICKDLNDRDSREPPASIDQAFADLNKIVKQSEFFDKPLFDDDPFAFAYNDNECKVKTDDVHEAIHFAHINIPRPTQGTDTLRNIFEAMDHIIRYFSSEQYDRINDNFTERVFSDEQLGKKDKVLDLLAKFAEAIFSKFVIGKEPMDYQGAIKVFELSPSMELGELFKARAEASTTEGN